MPIEKVGYNPPIPEGSYTPEELRAMGAKKTVDEEPTEEKEAPSDSPTEEKPAEEEEGETESEEKSEEEKPEELQGDDTGDKELLSQVQGLQTEREKLLKEIVELRGQRREIKQEEIKQVDKQIDELKDLNPEDAALIDRVIKAKGYITKDQIKSEFYNIVKQQELDKFLNKYPEFKPENDPNDVNWNAFNRELAWLRFPEDPHKIAEVLERAKKAIAPIVSGRADDLQKRKLQTAGLGSGGGSVRRSSSSNPLNASQREALSRGGYTEEEIANMEK